MSFSKILVANRGEIALRVMRTASRLGYATVAVFSEADRASPHVLAADEAVFIGASEPQASYLNIQALLEATQKTGADAVHPGYGFLSENPVFAQACLDAGLVFIGPPPSAMLAMGNKAMAKRRMVSAGVPCAAGYLGEDQSDAALTREALGLGFPLMVKAVAGGGGRGMRLVHETAELPQALVEARREASNSFGDGTLMLERLIEQGRHIEIQVFADAHGNAVHLGERDCTAQRRRQKVIEEAPSPIVSPALREAMGQHAVAAALAVGYIGAGTVEFMVDRQFNPYFLEMNTRLQVEHPVTEMITGLDLVEWQLRVAAGERLPATQSQISFTGHAIEARLCAEDPYANFAPQAGQVLHWQPGRAVSAGARIDDGIVQGSVVSPYYDAMVAKVIVLGRDRVDAIRRLRAALGNTPLLGLRHNGRFLSDLLDSASFRDAAMTTGLIDEWQQSNAAILRCPLPNDAAWRLAAAVLALKDGSTLRPSSVAAFDLNLVCNGTARAVRVQGLGGGAVRVTIQGDASTDAQQSATVRLHGPVQDGLMRFEDDRLAGVLQKATMVLTPNALHLDWGGASFVFSEASAFADTLAQHDAGRALAPMAGRITQVLAQVGADITLGQPLVCVEAMKMEMWVSASAAGRVVAVHAQVGEQVASGALLVEVDVLPTPSAANRGDSP
jgi:geranyl-CoA carboxylase alpha subunit